MVGLLLWWLTNTGKLVATQRAHNAYARFRYREILRQRRTRSRGCDLLASVCKLPAES